MRQREPVKDLGDKYPPKDKRTRKQIQIDFKAKSWVLKSENLEI